MIKTAITGNWRFAVYMLIAIIYYLICYATPRDQSFELIALYAIIFLFYLAVIKWQNSDQLIREGIWFCFGLRVLILFSTPNLSDDFYRFIWDGNLINNGINPFTATPEIINNLQNGNYHITGLSEHLYSLLNSKQYYSVYPPVCQAAFGCTAKIAGGDIYLNIILLKFLILLFETGTILILIRLLNILNISKHNMLIYAANPLIIIELCGNIHFEAAMIFFLAASFYFLSKRKDILAAFLFGLAISSKLLPLIFLPLLFKYIGFRRTIIFSGIAGCITVFTFLPFLDAAMLQNMSASLNLYFNEFEYNASFYYLGKFIGGWHDAEVKMLLQRLLPIITFLSIIALSIYYRKEMFYKACLSALVIYFFCSTTIHPWYISILVLFAAITGYRFVIYWTGLIIFTYITYRSTLNLENYYLIVLEYLSVISILIYEFNRDKQISNKLPAETMNN